MDKAVEHILSGPLIALIFLAAPGVGIGIYVMHILLQKLRNGRGENSDDQLRVKFDGTESRMSWAQLYGQVEAINVTTRQILDRIHTLEGDISALRKENGARADAISRLGERIATIEGRSRSRQ